MKIQEGLHVTTPKTNKKTANKMTRRSALNLSFIASMHILPNFLRSLRPKHSLMHAQAGSKWSGWRMCFADAELSLMRLPEKA